MKQKEKDTMGEIEVDEGRDVIDLGNATEETRQPWHVPMVQDGPITFGILSAE